MLDYIFFTPWGSDGKSIIGVKIYANRKTPIEEMTAVLNNCFIKDEKIEKIIADIKIGINHFSHIELCREDLATMKEKIEKEWKRNVA